MKYADLPRADASVVDSTEAEGYMPIQFAGSEPDDSPDADADAGMQMLGRVLLFATGCFLALGAYLLWVLTR